MLKSPFRPGGIQPPPGGRRNWRHTFRRRYRRLMRFCAAAKKCGKKAAATVICCPFTNKQILSLCRKFPAIAINRSNSCSAS
ncbi:hypothetical protein DJ518_02960 [Klebsiella pneumoniae]|nr:hypothetical protein DJ518_02960 [Klebsiella pneumoniae]